MRRKRSVELILGSISQSIALWIALVNAAIFLPSLALVSKYSSKPNSSISELMRTELALFPDRSVRAAIKNIFIGGAVQSSPELAAPDAELEPSDLHLQTDRSHFGHQRLSMQLILHSDVVGE